MENFDQGTRKRLILWSAVGALVIALLVYGFLPKPLAVDLTQVQSQHLEVTIKEEAETRVQDVYQLSAPIRGRLRRIEVEVGDWVVAGETVVADIEPLDPDFLDPRSEAQAKADVQAAESAQTLAQAQLKEAQAEFEFAESEVLRIRELRLTGTASQRELDNAERVFKATRAALDTAQAGLQMRSFELQRVQATLLPPTQTQSSHGICECLAIVAPISGRVLSLHRESEGVVDAGTALVAIGDPKDLELVTELLSVDAVKVRPGQRVKISNWGGDQLLEGRVKKIDPMGFTKVSALGIEEQRVNVVIDITSPYADWQRLGHGYQVDTDIVLWQGDDVLSVPLTALFRQGQEWMVYSVHDGVVQQRLVTLGKQNTLRTQITDGLQDGDWIVTYPSEGVKDGAKVEARNQG